MKPRPRSRPPCRTVSHLVSVASGLFATLVLLSCGSNSDSGSQDGSNYYVAIMREYGEQARYFEGVFRFRNDRLALDSFLLSNISKVEEVPLIFKNSSITEYDVGFVTPDIAVYVVVTADSSWVLNLGRPSLVVNRRIAYSQLIDMMNHVISKESKKDFTGDELLRIVKTFFHIRSDAYQSSYELVESPSDLERNEITDEDLQFRIDPYYTVLPTYVVTDSGITLRLMSISGVFDGSKLTAWLSYLEIHYDGAEFRLEVNEVLFKKERIGD